MRKRRERDEARGMGVSKMASSNREEEHDVGGKGER
jgi:hypothetical protein